MAATEAMHAFGFELEISTDDSSYSDVLEIVNAGSPGQMRVAAKATHNGSPETHTEAKPGIKSTDPLTFTINHVAAQRVTLQTYFDAGTELYWKVKLPLDSGQSTPEDFKFVGFITKLGGIKLDPEDTSVMVYDVEVTRSTGKVTRTAGA